MFIWDALILLTINEWLIVDYCWGHNEKEPTYMQVISQCSKIVKQEGGVLK